MKAMWMAYNHNGIALLREPTTKFKAQREASEYTLWTSNAAYIEQVKSNAK